MDFSTLTLLEIDIMMIEIMMYDWYHDVYMYTVDNWSPKNGFDSYPQYNAHVQWRHNPLD